MLTRVVILLLLSGAAHGHDLAHYLGNEAVLIESGPTKVVFDPLFDEDFDLYDRVPEDTKRKLLAGEAPFDGVEAAFVSHHHDDHFDPALMLHYLERQPDLRLFAPGQAVSAMLELARPEQAALFRRIERIELATGDAALTFEVGDIVVEALRVPHAGWPDRHRDVENIVYRVTLNDRITVSHLGDADPKLEYYDPVFWAQRRARLALPPYWFLIASEGRDALLERLNAAAIVGIHVPTEIADDPDQRPESLQGVDLFTEPGETRELAVN